MKKNLTQKGFTLVELAIVMVVIGLMIGAVLKGQAMIDDAKQKRLMNDLQGISAAYFTYYDRYNAMPGDDMRNHGWDGVTPATGGDAGDGYINGSNTTNGNEAHEAWQAVRYTGLLSGDPAATGLAHLPNTPFGGKYTFGNRSFGSAIGQKNYIEIAGISGNIAESVDIKFDDGVYDTGTVQADDEYTEPSVDLYYAL